MIAKLTICFILISSISPIVIEPLQNDPLLPEIAPIAPPVVMKCVHDNQYPCIDDGRGEVIGITESGEYTIFKNNCEACKWPEIDLLTRVLYCPSERRCTDYPQPICVLLSDGGTQEYKSECDACADSTHKYFPDKCNIHSNDIEVL